LSSLIAACLEILLCHGWANGNLAMEKSLMERLTSFEQLILNVFCEHLAKHQIAFH
jgi:hypothetical protein